MEQDFVLINITRREIMANYVAPSRTPIITQFASSVKMSEHLLHLGNKPFLAMSLVEILDSTHPSIFPMGPVGTWSGSRIVIVGEYCDDIPAFVTRAEEEELQESGDPNLYDFAEENYENVPNQDFSKNGVRGGMVQLFPQGSHTHHLVLNLDKKEYLDPKTFHENVTYVEAFAKLEHGIMQGLFSLIFFTTGGGEGDVDEFKQGRWAGDRITIREKEKVVDLESWSDISEKVTEDLKKFMDKESTAERA
ncbi:hypothetical protein EDD21DRAFT_404631 [Dissophora ornata]|nr:hypothetical protein BGZ58_009723 [Dissophora ornata]KAI8601209.1 hypothetical protein EDD21DRAFT_404631 [Dissophora ornata]